jgi:hypothetical protein
MAHFGKKLIKCYAIGIIRKEIFKDLGPVNDTKNEFAYNREFKKFERLNIKEQRSELRIIRWQEMKYQVSSPSSP